MLGQLAPQAPECHGAREFGEPFDAVSSLRVDPPRAGGQRCLRLCTCAPLAWGSHSGRAERSDGPHASGVDVFPPPRAMAVRWAKRLRRNGLAGAVGAPGGLQEAAVVARSSCSACGSPSRVASLVAHGHVETIASMLELSSIRARELISIVMLDRSYNVGQQRGAHRPARGRPQCVRSLV